MPVKKYMFSKVMGDVRTFLNLEAGVTRDGATSGQSEVRGLLGQAEQQAAGQNQRIADQNRELEQARRLLAVKDRELAELRAKLDGNSRETVARGVKAQNIIWIFGTGRSGNTWLSSMMEELARNLVWREPSIGRLFGEFYYFQSREGQRGTENFVFGEKQKTTWLRSIRNFILEGASGRFPELGDGYLVIKEQVGSVGAPLLMNALPESRMILLIRDPRDVVASWMNATRKGGWRYDRLKKSDPEWRPVADEDPDAFVEERANHYLKNVSKAKEAYEKHEGHKVLVRYEELREDALGTMKRVYSELGIGVDEEELAQAVKKHSWERVPEEEKGEGKFHRKATPGGWREDLTEEQVETVESITAPLLEEFYPG